jgi:uroporphyrinogen-III decarboxylase
MKPEERIYTAISGKTPDRVPVVPKIWVDLGARITGTSLVEVITDPFTALRVIVDTGLACQVDAVRQFHFPKRRVLEKDEKVFEIDGKEKILGEIDMMGGLMTHLYDPRDFHLEDPYLMAYYQYWSSKEPFVRSLEDVPRITIPNKKFYEEIGCGDRQREIMKSVGDRLAILGDCGSATLAFHVSLRGMENALLDLIEKPKLVHSVMEKGVAIAVEKGKFNIGLGLRILRLNDSVGNMSVISPKHWRTFVFPHMKEVCTELHRYNPEAKIYCHICGNILPIAEDLVETGLDCIGPLDPLGGSTPAEVRNRVGDAVSLMGGVDTLSFINNTSDEIIAEARQCIIQAGQKGGYILGSGCVVPRNAKRENVEALSIASERYGIYRNGRLCGLQEPEDLG